MVFIGLGVNVKAQIHIEKSTNIVQDIKGNNFYLHIVQKGQTLYAIAKAYDVKVNDIIAVNHGSENGIKNGQELKIPKLSLHISQNQVLDTVAPSGFVYHRVVKGETLYRIMFNYQITLSELKKYNTGLNSNIQIGQLILIPSVETRKVEQAANQYDSLIDYTLRRRDNYYRLEKKFKINQQQIEQLNPSLKTTGLQKDFIIKLPYIHDEFIAPEYSTIVLDSVKPKPLPEEKINLISANCDKINFNRHVYKIGYMLPLFENLNNEIDVENEYKIKRQNEYKSFRFIQFVQGAKLAIDSLEKMGFKAEVYFWDNQASQQKTDSICKLDDFKQLDLLIGPFYNKNVAIARQTANLYNIKMIDVFGGANFVDEINTDYFIVKATEQNSYAALAKYISDSLLSYKISIIYQGHADEIDRLHKLKKALYSNYLHIDTNNIFIYLYQNNGVHDIINSLQPTTTNIIFNLVDDEASVSNFLRQLNLKRKNNRIMVMSLDKYWSKYQTLELEYLTNLNYTCSRDYQININDSNLVIPFQNKFYNTFKRMPEEYAFLAYDISWYFGNALYFYGTNFSGCLSQFRYETMHNIFNFVDIREGVFLNTNVNILQYNNYQTIRKN